MTIDDAIRLANERHALLAEWSRDRQQRGYETVEAVYGALGTEAVREFSAWLVESYETSVRW